jgi:transcriptional regulator with XRE-family HTH domain
MPQTSYALGVTNTIRAEMARRKMSQKDLADALGLSQPAASRRLNGHTEFTVGELLEIAAVLGVAPAVLLGEDAA